VTRGFSRYLDGLRVFAAFTVFASHFAYARFSGGAHLWIRELNLGSDAVVLFFVLSGFIIDFTAETKDKTLGAFAFSRATRIYSVALPALVVTFVLDALGSRLHPADYAGWWYDGDRSALRFFTASTFTNELWFLHLRPGTNGPYWSLTYEVWYYVIFAVLLYSPRKKGLLAVLLCLATGPKPLLLAPAFALGVWVHRRAKQAPPPSLRFAGLFVFGTPLLYALFLATDVPHDLKRLTAALLGEAAVSKLGFSDEFIWNDAIAGLVAIHLLGVHSLLERDRGKSLERDGKAEPAKAAPWREKAGAFVHFLSGGTFSLYLVHYPVMQFMASVLPGRPEVLSRQVVLASAVLVFCLVFAALFERTLPAQRAALRKRVWRIAPDAKA
jgi:peptidoglycan/LPS O-acetylase OafA/YrhL